MANPLFARIVPAESSASGQVIEFKGSLGDFQRLSEIVAADLGPRVETVEEWRSTPVQFRLAFAWIDSQRELPVAELQAEATITAVCQRCLEVFEYDLAASAKIVVVQQEVDSSDYAEAGDAEIWELEEETLRPVDIVEESLVMAMPLAPRHVAAQECTALVSAENDGAETNRPFADLKVQMEQSND